MRFIFPIIFLYCLFIGAQNVYAAATTTVIVSPQTILQGDPIMVTIQEKQLPKSITFDGQAIPIFTYKNNPTAFVGVDLKKSPGLYHLQITSQAGELIDKTINVTEREKIEEPLGIPQKLGGNTKASQNNLVTSLSKENATLNSVKTGKKVLWMEKFHPPLADITVTDPYGYNRKTGAYTIPHKGTDFKAAVGTKVMAMNRGVVKIAKTYQIYGKTVVIDHGLGVQTIYMHLSKINVKEGQLVRQDQVIGLSGKTGYAEMPHLHLSVKINGSSIDPIKFLSLFN